MLVGFVYESADRTIACQWRQDQQPYQFYRDKARSPVPSLNESRNGKGSTNKDVRNREPLCRILDPLLVSVACSGKLRKRESLPVGRVKLQDSSSRSVPSTFSRYSDTGRTMATRLRT